MTTKRLIVAGLAMGAGLMMLPRSASALLVIDDFTVNQATVSQSGLGTNSSSQAGPTGNIVGGVRDLTVQVTGGIAQTPGGNADVGITNTNKLTSSLDNNTNGKTTVVWDGTAGGGATPTFAPGLGGYDLTQSNTQNAVQILTQSDLQGYVTLTVYDNNAANYAILTHELAGFNNVVTIDYLFADFFVTGSVDFHSIDAIVLVIDGTGILGEEEEEELNGVAVAGLDANLRFIQTTFVGTPVPEPVTAALSLLSLGVLGLTATRRRRA